MTKKPFTTKNGTIREHKKGDFKGLRSLKRDYPDIVESFKAMGRGRPRLENPKKQITLRLSPDVLDYFRDSGDGWQTRMDQALRHYMETHT